MSLWWNIWSDEPVLINGAAHPTASPMSGGSGNVQPQSWQIEVPHVEILHADVIENEIRLRLEPPGIIGTLTLELTDPDTHVIRSEERTGTTGTLTETFDIDNLAAGEYHNVKATWNVNGASAEDEFDYHIKVLGVYHHTRYNTPNGKPLLGDKHKFQLYRRWMPDYSTM